jgi:Holliday junction resolvase RusA-like endonuclease|tara:strand:+ start:63 stop:497 length:435 start_codon:yes stop_codon:yes gene_type:complete
MNKVEIDVSGQPQGKARPRFTRTGHAYTPEQTRLYEARIGAAAWSEMKKSGLETTDRPVHVEIIAFMDIPKSWSAKKRLEAEYGAIRAVGKPDIDNIIKAALDGIAGPIIANDTQVVSVKAQKTYCHPDRGPVLYISVSWTDKE